MTPSNAVLLQQYNRIKADGWLPYFQDAGTQYNWPTEILLGIGSRETNLENIEGDFHNGQYHAAGVMQVDIGTDIAFRDSGAWKDVNQSIIRGAQILSGKRDYLSAHGVKETDMPSLTTASIAAYNTGEGNVYKSIRLHRGVDTTTTNGNYSRDVLARAAYFKTLLAQEPPASSQP